MTPETLDALRAARAARRPVALLTNLKSGVQTLFYLTDEQQKSEIPGNLVEAAESALRDDRCATVETAEGAVFVQVHNPPMRLVVVGAVHIASPLVPMAMLAGYAVTLVDPRAAFASAERFPGVELVHDWPGEALAALALDSRTAVVTLTHDPKLDDPALDAALDTSLASPVFYIGCLGSRRTHAKRCDRLRERGHGEAAIARIHGPIGLHIGALSPAEIAVSIVAEITAVRRQGDAGKS